MTMVEQIIPGKKGVMKVSKHTSANKSVSVIVSSQWTSWNQKNVKGKFISHIQYHLYNKLVIVDTIAPFLYIVGQ